MGLSFLGTKGMRVGAPHAAQTASNISRSPRSGRSPTRCLFGIAATFAANRLVLEAFFRIELLFTGGKDEFATAVTANESLVFEHVG